MNIISTLIKKLFKKKNNSTEFIEMCTLAYMQEYKLKPDKQTEKLVESLIKAKLCLEEKMDEVKVIKLLMVDLEQDILGKSAKISVIEIPNNCMEMVEKKELN